MRAHRDVVRILPLLLAGIAVAVGVATVALAWGRSGADGFGVFGVAGGARVLSYVAYALIGALVASRLRADAVVARLRGTVVASVDPVSVGVVLLGPGQEDAR